MCARYAVFSLRVHVFMFVGVLASTNVIFSTLARVLSGCDPVQVQCRCVVTVSLQCLTTSVGLLLYHQRHYRSMKAQEGVGRQQGGEGGLNQTPQFSGTRNYHALRVTHT